MLVQVVILHYAVCLKTVNHKVWSIIKLKVDFEANKTRETFFILQ